MQLTVLGQTSPLLQDYMQKQNFSQSYIKRHVQFVNFIMVRAPMVFFAKPRVFLYERGQECPWYS